MMNELSIGTVLKGKSYQYVIERTLGQGSFGITYLASVKMAGALGAIDANIKVAIKEFFMRDINGRSDATVTSGSKGGIYDDYKKKFTREAINLSKLQHPNIIKVIESFEANNTVYYVMEYIAGGSLDDYILKNNGLKEDEAIKIIKQIGSALSFMHKNKMLHLDLKPSNIMRKESGDIVLIDFGLSKQYDSKGEPESSTKVGAGTPGYAPIEQANYRDGKGFPVTMDVYALGATMFKMLTGIRPPEASDILNDGFPLFELQEHKVSDRISGSIAKAMAPIKKDRYNSAESFIRSIDGEETIIDVKVKDERPSHKINTAEKVFKVRPNTSKVTLEFCPRTPCLQGAYLCSVSKETGVNPNITQESTHNWKELSEREYVKFLNDLQSLNLEIRDKEVPPYSPCEYSEDPARLAITLYDENCKVYNKLWISGWNNELGNIDGELYAIEEKIRQITPILQDYIDGPYYEIPNYTIRINDVKASITSNKEKVDELNNKKKNFGKKSVIIVAILFCCIISYLLWPRGNNMENYGNESPSDTITNIFGSSLPSNYDNVHIGDYFYSDGSVSSVLDQSKNCIGVIYSLNPTDTEREKGWTHGHIVAMEDVENGHKYKWGPTKDLGAPHTNIEYDRKMIIADRNGYVYTYEGLTDSNFPAFEAVRNYSAPLPSNTSGWYIPSAGQWYEILKSIGKMKKFSSSYYPYIDNKAIMPNLSKINIKDGIYLTSSERDATIVHIIDFNDNPKGFYAPYLAKVNKYRVRAVAAF